MQSTHLSAMRVIVIAFVLTALLALALGFVLLQQHRNSGSSLEAIFSGPYELHEYSIEFDRTACFGSCPVFNLRIEKDGNAVLLVPGDKPFEGKLRIPDIKDIRYSKVLTDEARLDLVSTLEKGGFWKMNYDYSYAVTDNPSQTMSVQSKDRSRVVHVYAVPCVKEGRELKESHMKDWNFKKLVPDVFCDLEDKLDAIACDVYKNGRRSLDDGTEAIWPPQCDKST